MRFYTIALSVFLLVACSTPDKENKTPIIDSAGLVKPVTPAVAPDDPKWATYVDTINTGYMISFKYAKHFFVEHFENAECIGKKIKMFDDGPMTTMNCSLWMNDISKDNVRSVDTLVLYKLQALNVNEEVLKDTITIANVKGTRARYYNIKGKEKVLRQSIFFTKYNTLFEVYNDSLPADDFEMFVKSLKIEK